MGSQVEAVAFNCLGVIQITQLCVEYPKYSLLVTGENCLNMWNHGHKV